MAAPDWVFWALSVVFVALAVPCLARLARGHPASELRSEVNRGDEAAELLMALGMLAMVIPVGGPVPLAGWVALFGGVAIWAAFAWARIRTGGGDQGCVASQCGHHSLMAVAMLYMFTGVAGHGAHGADPWLTVAGHEGVLPLTPMAIALVVYCLVDMAVCAARGFVAGSRQRMPVLFRGRTRATTRAAMSASMAGMLLAMV